MLIKKYIIKISLFIFIFSSSHSLEMQTIERAKGLQPSTKIVGGTQVPESDNSWRYVVALLDRDFQFCAGSLISPNWVLTAAHCVSGQSPSSFTVGTGSYNRTQLTSRTISRIIIHENYGFDNDIALIELSNPVSSVNPISYAVPSTPTSTGIPSETAGWGTQSSGGISSDDLLEVLVPIVNRDTCNAANAYNGEVTDNMLCAGYMAGGKDSCQGDSGGPLMANNRVIGIVSWGYGCAAENLPGVYTNVKNYANWIAKNIGDPLYIQPDYTPKIKLVGAVTHGTNITVPAVLTLTELVGGSNNGDVVMRIPKHAYMSFTYDSSMTTHIGKTVHNSNWEVDTTRPSEYRFKYIENNGVFPSNNVSRIGVNLTVSPDSGNSGEIDFLLDIKPGNGDENQNNDQDASKIGYDN